MLAKIELALTVALLVAVYACSPAGGPAAAGEDAASADGSGDAYDSGQTEDGDQQGADLADAADSGSDPGYDGGQDAGSDPGADPGQHPCDPGVPVSNNILDQHQMIIVTGPALVQEFERLADWKRAKGVPTLVVDTDTIAANVSGVDLPAKIREYIRLRKLEGAQWVLLGGDAEVVPPRMVHTRALTQFDEIFASDFYYSDLDGTWDANGNGTYGEVADDCEMHPDIAVGRLTVAALPEAQTAIDRILLYEQTDSGKVLKTLFISEDTGFMGFDSAAQLNPLAENTFPARFEKQKLYWKWESYPGSEENTLAAQIAALEDGRNLVTHYGHASEYDLNMEMSAQDVDSLHNSPYFPIYVTCGCMAGNFTYSGMDSAGERLITNPNGGAVAYLGNANYGLGPGGGTAFIQAFYQALFAGTTRIGSAMMTARDNFYTQESNLQSELLGIRWTQFVVVLFGDPEMEARIEVPGQLEISHAQALGRGEQCLEVAVTLNGQPAAGATVTVYRRAAYLFRQQTDSSGRTTFRFDPGAAGLLDVTATLSQNVPALSAVEVY